MKIYFLLLWLIVFSVKLIQAQVISQVSVAGSVCNDQNSSITTTADGQSLSVLFQDFQLIYPTNGIKRAIPQITDLMTSDIHGGSLQMVDYHYCVIQLNIKEINQKIVNVTLGGDARGLVSLPKGFKASYKIAIDHHTGLKSPSRSRSLIAKQYWQGIEEDWSNSFSKKLNISGSCKGATKSILIKVMLGLSKDKKSEGDAMVTLDSLDKNLSKLKLDFKTAPCR